MEITQVDQYLMLFSPDVFIDLPAYQLRALANTQARRSVERLSQYRPVAG